MNLVFSGFSANFICRTLRGGTAACALLLVAGCATTESGGNASPSKIRAVIEPSLMAAAATSEAKFDYEAAANSYTSLLQRRPDDADLAVRLARVLRYGGKIDNAIGVLTPLSGGERPPVPVLIELGKAHLAADHLNLAQRYLNQARSIAPENWEVLSALGVSLDYQGKYADAQAAYLEALSLSPNNPTILNNLSLSQAQSGDLAGAIDTQRKTVDQPQATAQMRQNLALLLAMNGQVDEAERYARMDLPREVLRENQAYFRSLNKNR